MTTPTAPPQSRHAGPADTTQTTSPHNGAGGLSWPVLWRWASFVAGCALLVACAWALGSRVPQWTRDHGTIIVFLCFFLVMSVAGRWFWMGIDAALNRVIGGHE